jgi:hypothetical protein
MLNKTATPRTDKVIRESNTAKLPVALSMHAMGLEQEADLLFEALKGIMEAPLDGGINTSDAITDAHSVINIVRALRAGEGIISTKKEPHT